MKARRYLLKLVLFKRNKAEKGYKAMYMNRIDCRKRFFNPFINMYISKPSESDNSKLKIKISEDEKSESNNPVQDIKSETPPEVPVPDKQEAFASADEECIAEKPEESTLSKENGEFCLYSSQISNVKTNRIDCSKTLYCPPIQLCTTWEHYISPAFDTFKQQEKVCITLQEYKDEDIDEKCDEDEEIGEKPDKKPGEAK